MKQELMRWHGRHVLTALMALCPLMVMAKVPAFNQRFTCDELRIPLPKQVTKEAPPAVETFTYTWTRGGKSGTDERFDPRQLWEAEQRLAAWSDSDGNQYELVAPTSVIDSFNRGIKTNYSQLMPHVLKEEYEDNRQAVGKLVRKRLPQWLEDWTGNAFSAPQKLQAMAAVKEAMFAESPKQAALIFFLKANQNKPYVLLVTPADDPPKTWKSALTRAVGGIAPASKMKPTAEVQEGWKTMDRPPYRVLSNLPKQYGKFVSTLLDNMIAMRAVYVSYLPEPKKMKVPLSVIRIFSKPEEYHAYAGAGAEWSSGVFSSTHRELVVMGDIGEGSKKEQTEDIQSVTFHEGFHQYLFSITPPAIHVPIWFNEGHATFFETFTLKRTTVAGKRKTEGRPALSQRLETVRQDPRFCSPEGLKLLMSFSPEIFYHQRNRTAAYASSWLIVHWLRTEAPAPLAATLNQYYALICKEKTPEEVAATVYTPEILQQISDGLIDFLNKHTYKH